MIKNIGNYLRKLHPVQRVHLNNEPQKAEGGEKKFSPREMIKFCVPLVEHCNLRCRGCDHFAPLAEEEYADLALFEDDLARLSYLTDGKADKIGLMGGEPLLNPRVTEYFHIARKYFQKSKIRMVTNGVLLLKQKEDFWEACRNNNIIIEVTRYPIHLNFEKMKSVAQKNEVYLTFYDDTGESERTSNHIPLDLEGRQDIRKNFINCYHANNTIFLKKGRLYTCTIAPNINHFIKFFDVDIKTSPADSIDIHEAQSADEIMQFLSKPIPLCRYCYVEKRTFGHPWKRSHKDIKEWTL